MTGRQPWRCPNSFPPSAGHGTRRAETGADGIGDAAGILTAAMAGTPARPLPALLTRKDPRTAPADPQLAEAAISYAHTCVGDVAPARLWAGYAADAVGQLDGPYSASARRAGDVYRQRLAWRQLSVVAALHDAGQCGRASLEFGGLRRQWNRRLGDRAYGQQLVLIDTAFLIGCGKPVHPDGHLYGSRAVFAGLAQHGRVRAAQWLTAVANAHPQVCQYAGPRTSCRDLHVWLLILGLACEGKTMKHSPDRADRPRPQPLPRDGARTSEVTELPPGCEPQATVVGGEPSATGRTAPADPVAVCRWRVDLFRELGWPDEMVAAQIELANALHGDGRCCAALAEIAAARSRWQQHPINPRHGERIVLSHAAFLAGCGLPHDAVRLLDSEARLLVGLGAAAFDEAARWFALAESRHRATCAIRDRPAPTGDRHRYWADVLSAFVGPAARHQPGGRA